MSSAGSPAPSRSTIARQLCMPPQQISPSAASRSPCSSATSQARRKVSAIVRVLPGGSLAQSSTLAAESIRTTPPLRMPSSRSCRAMPQALRTMSTKRWRSVSLPIAEPPPTGGHTGATTEPTSRFFAAILSASLLISSFEESMLVCGSARKRSTPSNLMPPTSVAAVRSSISSRPIGGSEAGPLPTRPGHIALCSFGKLLRPSTVSSSHSQCHPSSRPRASAESFSDRRRL